MKTRILIMLLSAAMALCAAGCSEAATQPAGEFPVRITIAEGSSLFYNYPGTQKTWSGGDEIVLDWDESTGIFTISGLPYNVTVPTLKGRTLNELKKAYGPIPSIGQYVQATVGKTDELTCWSAAIANWQKAKNALIDDIQKGFTAAAGPAEARLAAAISTLKESPLLESATLDPRQGKTRLVHVTWKGGRTSTFPLPAEETGPGMLPVGTEHPVSLDAAKSTVNILKNLERPGCTIEIRDGNWIIDISR